MGKILVILHIWSTKKYHKKSPYDKNLKLVLVIWGGGGGGGIKILRILPVDV